MRAWSVGFVLLCGGCLSYQSFLDQKNDKFCEQYAVCNPDADCELPDEATVSDTGCDFDASAARDCLKGEWACNTSFPGYEYPSAPSACLSVCR